MYDEYGRWIDTTLPGLTSLSAPAPAPFTPGSWDTLAQGGTLSTTPGSGFSSLGGFGAPAVQQPGGLMGGIGKLSGWLGKNGQTIGNWANVLGQGVNAYVGLKQLSLAKDALKFEKNAFKTNLRNQTQSYNTQVKDRLTGRWYATEEERQAALKEAELSDKMAGG